MKDGRFLFILLFCLLIQSPGAASFLEQAVLREDRSVTFQRIFITHYLEKARKKYSRFLQESNEKDFQAHLQISTFGRALYQYLSDAESSHPAQKGQLKWVQKNYASLANQEFSRMKERISSYYDSGSFDHRIYAVTLRFAMQYQALVTRLAKKEISAQNFRFQEGRLLEGIGSLELDSSTHDVIRDLLFIEFQLKGKGT